MTSKEENMLELLRSMNSKTVSTYAALGIKPGDGGKFAPYMAGYEAAMTDVRAMLQSILQSKSYCPHCDAPWEIVRPGKSQPTCNCQDMCPDCGMERRHFAVGELAPNIGGFLCQNCDATPSNQEEQP